MRAHPEILRPLFVSGQSRLNVQSVISLFETVLSPPGSNARRSENLTITFWRDWLIDVGGKLFLYVCMIYILYIYVYIIFAFCPPDGSRTVSLEEVLTFASGVAEIPPLGFPERPQLEFLHAPHNDGARRRYPEANTCSVILRLPIHATYEDFVDYMESGIKQSPTFGFA